MSPGGSEPHRREHRLSIEPRYSCLARTFRIRLPLLRQGELLGPPPCGHEISRPPSLNAGLLFACLADLVTLRGNASRVSTFRIQDRVSVFARSFGLYSDGPGYVGAFFALPMPQWNFC